MGGREVFIPFQWLKDLGNCGGLTQREGARVNPQRLSRTFHTWKVYLQVVHTNSKVSLQGCFGGCLGKYTCKVYTTREREREREIDIKNTCISRVSLDYTS